MKFSADEFFNLDNFVWKNYLSNVEYVWEHLSKIDEYIGQILEKNNSDKIVLGEGSVIQDTARIEGKAVIGKNCIIGHGVLLRAGVIIGDNVSIGHGGEIKHSIILDDSSVAHLNYVGDSIIGSDVNISGGAILANWRFDKKKIRISTSEGHVETGLEKFGAIVGDGTTIGVNAVLNPGTIIGKKSLLFPLTSVAGCHPEKSVIKTVH